VSVCARADLPLLPPCMTPELVLLDFSRGFVFSCAP
jgi:hypothetical protein